MEFARRSNQAPRGLLRAPQPLMVFEPVDATLDQIAVLVDQLARKQETFVSVAAVPLADWQQPLPNSAPNSIVLPQQRGANAYFSADPRRQVTEAPARQSRRPPAKERTSESLPIRCRPA